MNRSEWFEKYPEVHCDRREFSQVFSVEESDARGQRRYKYTCCTLGLTNGPWKAQQMSWVKTKINSQQAMTRLSTNDGQKFWSMTNLKIVSLEKYEIRQKGFLCIEEKIRTVNYFWDNISWLSVPYLHTLSVNSNYQSSSVKLISSRKKITWINWIIKIHSLKLPLKVRFLFLYVCL